MAEPAPETRPADEGISTPTVTEGTPAATEDVATPISRDEDPKSRRVSLADLSAKGTALYAHKQYEDAAEIFSRASVLQVELNGETAPENAEILFHYGRSLFKVGQSKSDVLGGPAAADQKNAAAAAAAADSSSKPAAPALTEAQKMTQEGVTIAAGQAGDAHEKKEDKTKEGGPDEKKPLFQFTGDENFDDSSDEEVGWIAAPAPQTVSLENTLTNDSNKRKHPRKRTMTWQRRLKFSTSLVSATKSSWSN